MRGFGAACVAALAVVAAPTFVGCGTDRGREGSSSPGAEASSADAGGDAGIASSPPVVCALPGEVVVPGVSSPRQLALTRRHLYYSGATTTPRTVAGAPIFRVPLAGGAPEEWRPELVDVFDVRGWRDFLAYRSGETITVLDEETGEVRATAQHDDVEPFFFVDGIVVAREPVKNAFLRLRATGGRLPSVPYPAGAQYAWLTGGGAGDAIVGSDRAGHRFALADAAAVAVAVPGLPDDSMSAVADEAGIYAVVFVPNAPNAIASISKTTGQRITIGPEQLGSPTSIYGSLVVAGGRLWFPAMRGTSERHGELISIEPSGANPVVEARGTVIDSLVTDGAHIAWVDRIAGCLEEGRACSGDIHIRCVP